MLQENLSASPRTRLEISPKIYQIYVRTQPEKPGPIYNYATATESA